MSISFFFFLKQKTTYERRISDWSSDVCSSDLCRSDNPHYTDNLSFAAKIWGGDDARAGKREKLVFRADENLHAVARPRAFQKRDEILLAFKLVQKQIGRASCRERVCQYG